MLVEPLDRVVEAIHAKLAEAITHETQALSARIEAGKMLPDLRKRIEAGEAGEVSWWEWYGKHFARSRRDAQRVMALAGAERGQ
jgi:hypothetical protein